MASCAGPDPGPPALQGRCFPSPVLTSATLHGLPGTLDMFAASSAGLRLSAVSAGSGPWPRREGCTSTIYLLSTCGGRRAVVGGEH